jgi:hypothetical protein
MPSGVTDEGKLSKKTVMAMNEAISLAHILRISFY